MLTPTAVNPLDRRANLGRRSSQSGRARCGDSPLASEAVKLRAASTPGALTAELAKKGYATFEAHGVKIYVSQDIWQDAKMKAILACTDATLWRTHSDQTAPSIFRRTPNCLRRPEILPVR